MSRRLTVLMAATLLSLGVAVQWCTAQMPPPARRGETVILLHGLLTASWHMKPIERALTREGFDVVNWGYDSREGTIEEHAQALYGLVKTLPSDRPTHFVGFSLGSLIIRYYLSHYDVPNAGRFVMIGPPNHGSELADELYPHDWFQALAGTEATGQLRATNHAFFEALGVPRIEFGIIAGGKGDDDGYSDVLPGDDDGRVSVASARLDGATDFIVLPHLHVMLLVTPDTIAQVATFLKTGRFTRSPQPPSEARGAHAGGMP